MTDDLKAILELFESQPIRRLEQAKTEFLRCLETSAEHALRSAGTELLSAEVDVKRTAALMKTVRDQAQTVEEARTVVHRLQVQEMRKTFAAMSCHTAGGIMAAAVEAVLLAATAEFATGAVGTMQQLLITLESVASHRSQQQQS